MENTNLNNPPPSPDVSGWCSLRTDPRTVFFFLSEERMKKFIETYWNEEKSAYKIGMKVYTGSANYDIKKEKK